jgi:periplasmic divalent cation tolerance protein
MDDPIVVFCTAPSAEEAKTIARILVDERMAACAQIVPGMTSLYVWEGKPCEESEVLMLLKTRRRLFDALAERIRGLHSYRVPEIVAVPVSDGSPPYLRWMESNLSGERTPDHG